MRHVLFELQGASDRDPGATGFWTVSACGGSYTSYQVQLCAAPFENVGRPPSFSRAGSPCVYAYNPYRNGSRLLRFLKLEGLEYCVPAAIKKNPFETKL